MTNATPGVLAGDPRFSALADLSARQLEQDVAQVLVNLVELVAPQALPYLIEQFHVSDLAPRDDAARRQLVLSAIELHRHRGTPWAVKQALSLMGIPDATLTEWFEVSGTPGTFSVQADVFDMPVDLALHGRAANVISRVKNARSHLVTLKLNPASRGQSPFVAACSTQSVITEIYPRVQVI